MKKIVTPQLSSQEVSSQEVLSREVSSQEVLSREVSSRAKRGISLFKGVSYRFFTVCFATFMRSLASLGMTLRGMTAGALFFFTLFSHAVINAATSPTLKEKIGQMLLVGFPGDAVQANDSVVQAILTHQLGGVILYNKDFQTKGPRNITNPQQLKQLTQDLQRYARQAAGENHRDDYPLLIGIDYEGGKVNNLPPEKGFPETSSAAQIGTASIAEANKAAQSMAKTLQTLGINLDFAPVVDVNINPQNPIIAKYGRSFSEDPSKVVTYAQIYAKAFHDHGILCTYKHFPGHGSATGDTHKNFVDVTQTWTKTELIPYQKLMHQPDSCPLIMTAHITNRKLDLAGYPASLSQAMTTNLLRNQLHFRGLVITDDLQMKAIADHYDLASIVRLAINAGADLLMFSNQLAKTPVMPDEIIDAIYTQVQSGKIARERIDQAYGRIVALKRAMAASHKS